jgi:ubiquinone/menaquinone biosynthesis C-methylase UbiE
MKKLSRSRDVIKHSIPYMKGVTLDLGAGSAKYKGLIQPRVSKYVAFDMEPGPHIDIVGDILALPIESNTYDTVISTQVLEHVKKPWVMASEIYRIVKPGGHLILTAPFMIPYHAHPGDYFRYTKEGMIDLFTSLGFEIVECSSYGGLFGVISEMIHFTVFSPYDGKPKGKISRKIVSLIESCAASLDGIIPSKTIYPNVYIIAVKK